MRQQLQKPVVAGRCWADLYGGELSAHTTGTGAKLNEEFFALVSQVVGRALGVGNIDPQALASDIADPKSPVIFAQRHYDEHSGGGQQFQFNPDTGGFSFINAPGQVLDEAISRVLNGQFQLQPDFIFGPNGPEFTLRNVAQSDQFDQAQFGGTPSGLFSTFDVLIQRDRVTSGYSEFFSGSLRDAASLDVWNSTFAPRFEALVQELKVLQSEGVSGIPNTLNISARAADPSP